MNYLRKELLPRVGYDDVKLSLESRGKPVGDNTKFELVEELYGDIMLEKKLLGERAHKAIRELETQVIGLRKRKKTKLANQILARIDKMWKPLREVQAEARAAEKAKLVAAVHNAAMKLENDYNNWRSRVQQSRENLQAEYTPRGNSLKIDLSGLSPRGPEMSTPRGYQAAVQVAAGTAHACLVHKSGKSD
jgi:hypothetical protein